MREKSHRDQARFTSMLAGDVGVQAYELVMKGYSKAGRKLTTNDNSHNDSKQQAETPCACGIRSSGRAKRNKR